VSTKRPDVGLHVHITDETKPKGILVECRIIREGIVAQQRDQPANPSMVALTPLTGGPAETCEITPTNPKDRKITVEVVGWPVGMIALWNAYDRNYLRDVFTDEPFRWDGEMWWPLPGKSRLMGHDGKNYPPAYDGQHQPNLTMGAVIWDGVVPR
jgi:hypothetical protein